MKQHLTVENVKIHLSATRNHLKTYGWNISDACFFCNSFAVCNSSNSVLHVPGTKKTCWQTIQSIHNWRRAVGIIHRLKNVYWGFYTTNQMCSETDRENIALQKCVICKFSLTPSCFGTLWDNTWINKLHKWNHSTEKPFSWH